MQDKRQERPARRALIRLLIALAALEVSYACIGDVVEEELGTFSQAVSGCPSSCDDGQFCNGTETCDADTGGCVAGTPPQCDDGAWCNGYEYCDEDDDSCNDGAPPVCDDDQWCNGTETCDETNDTCAPGDPECQDPPGKWVCDEVEDDCDCINCQCDDGPGKEGSVSTSGDIKKGVKLPFVKASVKGDFGYSVEASYAEANCPECTATGEAEGSGDLTIGLATVELNAELSGNFSGSNTYCTSCNDDTCELYCDELQCREIGGGLSGSISLTKRYGLPKIGLSWGKYSVTFQCGVDVTPSLSGNGGASKSIGGSPSDDCEPCESCTTYNWGGGIGVSAAASCGMSITKGSKKLFGLGCAECFTLYGNADYSGSKTSGECENETCHKLVGKAGAKGHLGGCLGWGWFKAYVTCGAEVWGQATTDTCGPEEYTGDAKLWCNATHCGDTCYCCDGTWSPTCEAGQGSYQGCCAGHGGICDGRCQ